MKKHLKKLLGLSSFLLLSACQTQLKDIAACSELAIDRGYCVRIISGREQIVDEKHPLLDEYGEVAVDPDGSPLTWFQMRPRLISIPWQDYVKLKTFIIQTCKSSGQCDQAVSSWSRTIENLDNAAGSK